MKKVAPLIVSETLSAKRSKRLRLRPRPDDVESVISTASHRRGASPAFGDSLEVATVGSEGFPGAAVHALGAGEP